MDTKRLTTPIGSAQLSGSLAAALLVVLALLMPAGCASPWPAAVEKGLDMAGDNRHSLEKALMHYKEQGDNLKLEATQFLIANMEGHGFVLAAFFNKEHEEIPFNALDYDNFKEAQAAMDALEVEHGKIDYALKRSDRDIKTITASYLIENVDLAFKAWREKPWATAISFEVFCEQILPYRGSNEPLNSFRQACLDRHSDLPGKLEDPTDVREAGRLIQQDVHRWVRFSTLFYLHPTDQSFEEMDARRVGRREDISNMMSYAMRANAVPAASDYTPHWADRDNNHAWEVILDADGRGRAGLSNRAAKVYRKTFAIQHSNLAVIKREDEKVPRWLGGKSYADVTAQYGDVSDVTVSLKNPPPRGTRFVYICVFNDGEWKAIHWGRITGNRVTFTDMGRNIAYLPAYFVDDRLEPAGPPLLLTADGSVRTLGGENADGALSFEITATAPTTPDADTRIDRPRIVVKPGKTYELFHWREGWQSLGKRKAGDEPVSFDDVSSGRLYWLIDDDIRRLERIFTIEDGRQVWW